ncbi:MAG: hypothetical protein PHG04_04440 [Candidatus Nanoarchaeia archaeon]|nr:hypothetical protein [Candidatus Nanoarchaeia archaeon]
MSGSNTETLTDMVIDYSKYNKSLTPKEILDLSMRDLGYTQKDILHIAATYVKDALKKVIPGAEPIDISKYSPTKKFNEDNWKNHVEKMKELDLEERLEFQTALTAVISEELLKEFYVKWYKGDNDPGTAESMRNKTHAYLATSFLDDLCIYIKGPESGKFRVAATLSEFTTELMKDFKNGIMSNEDVVEEILENATEYFDLNI